MCAFSAVCEMRKNKNCAIINMFIVDEIRENPSSIGSLYYIPTIGKGIGGEQAGSGRG